MSVYQFTELLVDVSVNVDGFIYEVSPNVIGGSAKSTTTTEVKRIESCPNAFETNKETSYVPSLV